MANRKLSDADHLMRHVSYNRLVRDPDTDVVIGITYAAFELTSQDKGALSVTWVEHYGEKCEQTYGIAASRYRDSLRSKKLGSKSYFAIGQAAAVKECGRSFNKRIRIVHAPDGSNTGHVELRRFDDRDKELLEALAVEVFVERVPVTSLPLD